MRNCNCGQSGSSTIPRVVPGPGIDISGSGTASDPLVISSEVNSFAGAFFATDTATVDLTLTGAGTLNDPFILSGVTSVSMTELVDVNDPAGPAAGEVPIFNGTDWEFAKPPTQAPGLVNATGGITGDGTVATPLKVAVSDTTTTATTGTAIYVDSAGKLRAKPGAADWNTLANKPATFPTTWDEVAQKPASYPDAAKIGGHKLTVSTTAPSSPALDDLWAKKP